MAQQVQKDWFLPSESPPPPGVDDAQDDRMRQSHRELRETLDRLEQRVLADAQEREWLSEGYLVYLQRVASRQGWAMTFQSVAMLGCVAAMIIITALLLRDRMDNNRPLHSDIASEVAVASQQTQEMLVRIRQATERAEASVQAAAPQMAANVDSLRADVIRLRNEIVSLKGQKIAKKGKIVAKPKTAPKRPTPSARAAPSKQAVVASRTSPARTSPADAAPSSQAVAASRPASARSDRPLAPVLAVAAHPSTAPAVVAGSSRDVGSNTVDENFFVYITNEGDTVRHISDRHGIAPLAILALNQLDKDVVDRQLRGGFVLKLPR